MNRRSIPYHAIVFLAYLLLQVMLFDNMVLYGKVFCFIYIGFLLLIPFEISPVLLIITGFFTGFSIDLFSNSLGLNASVSVLVAFLRPYWLSLITPRGGYEEVSEPSVLNLGFVWFLTYALPLIFLHHFALFVIDAGGFIDVLYLLNKTIFSSLYTFILLVTGQYLLYNR